MRIAFILFYLALTLCVGCENTPNKSNTDLTVRLNAIDNNLRDISDTLKEIKHNRDNTKEV